MSRVAFSASLRRFSPTTRPGRPSATGSKSARTATRFASEEFLRVEVDIAALRPLTARCSARAVSAKRLETCCSVSVLGGQLWEVGKMHAFMHALTRHACAQMHAHAGALLPMGHGASRWGGRRQPTAWSVTGEREESRHPVARYRVAARWEPCCAGAHHATAARHSRPRPPPVAIRWRSQRSSHSAQLHRPRRRCRTRIGVGYIHGVFRRHLAAWLAPESWLSRLRTSCTEGIWDRHP